LVYSRFRRRQRRHREATTDDFRSLNGRVWHTVDQLCGLTPSGRAIARAIFAQRRPHPDGRTSTHSAWCRHLPVRPNHFHQYSMEWHFCGDYADGGLSSARVPWAGVEMRCRHIGRKMSRKICKIHAPSLFAVSESVKGRLPYVARPEVPWLERRSSWVCASKSGL